MDFYFKEYGQGQPIIILHGWLGISDHWISIGKYLSSQGYKVYIPDLPNHGRSFHTEGFSYKEMGEISNVFVKGEGIINPILIGHSMGGKISMEMINQEPDYYKAIIMIDIHFKDYYTLNSISNPILNKILIETNPSKFTSLVEALNYLQELGLEKKLIPLVLKNLELNNKKLRWRSNLPMLALESKNILEGIKLKKNSIPALLIRGENSKYVSQEDILSMMEYLPNLKEETILNSGHWIHVEQPTMLILAIIKFLNKIIN